MNKFQNLFDDLFAKHGSQGWWPVTPQSCHNDDPKPIYGLLGKSEKQKLEIIFGAILTQNTSWKNVEKAIIELNKRDLIDIEKILKLRMDELGAVIRSSGYYNQKAKKLKEICTFLKKYPIAKLEKMDLLEVRKLLLAISGIGPETADSILLYALEKPVFVVDTYTRRLLLKEGWIDEKDSYDEIQKLFMDALPDDPQLFNEFHALIVSENKH